MSDPGHRDPDGMTRGARRGFAVLAIAVLVTGVASTGASVTYANSTARRQDAIIAQLRAQQLAGCAFAADLGSVPIPDKPHPSKLGVSLVADSRAQWRELRCPGTLAPPSAGLVKWGRFYRIPVS